MVPIQKSFTTQPKVMLIPIVKISPAENEPNNPKATNRDLKKPSNLRSNENQLVVPNGRTGGKRRDSLGNPEESSLHYGSTTLRVNPVDKSCITQVANMKRAKNSVDFVTCTTCFPIFHKFMKRRK